MPMRGPSRVGERTMVRAAARPQRARQRARCGTHPCVHGGLAVALTFALAAAMPTFARAGTDRVGPRFTVAPGTLTMRYGDGPGLKLDVVRYGAEPVLRVRNRTPFIVILYVQGVRVGWLRPLRTGRMRGLKRGYHRVYAHSRWGTVAWGPRSIWVPGSWNLNR